MSFLGLLFSVFIGTAAAQPVNPVGPCMQGQACYINGGTQTGADVSGNNVTAATGGIGGTNSLADWFSDLTKGTGATSNKSLWQFGSGTLITTFTPPQTPRRISILDGSAASPVGFGSTVSVSRYQNITNAALCGNSVGGNTECDAALNIQVKDLNTNTQIVSGINVLAQTIGTATNVQAGNFVSYISGGGYAEGVWSEAIRFNTTGHAWGAEIRTTNWTNSDCADIPSNGIGECIGLVINTQGNALPGHSASAVLSVTNPYQTQFKDGFVFAGTNPVINNSFWDRGTSTTSVRIEGTHTNSILVGTTGGQAEFQDGLSVLNSQLVVGSSSTPFSTYAVTIRKDDFNGVALTNFNAGASGFGVDFYHARGASIVQNNDTLGTISFFGYDGSSYHSAGQIYLKTTTPGAGIIPGMFGISTANTAGVLTSALTIDDAQSVTVATSGLIIGNATGGSKGVGTINAATGLYANNNAGLSATKTVRASGGAADCTLIYTMGLLTGGTC